MSFHVAYHVSSELSGQDLHSFLIPISPNTLINIDKCVKNIFCFHIGTMARISEYQSYQGQDGYYGNNLAEDWYPGTKS